MARPPNLFNVLRDISNEANQAIKDYGPTYNSLHECWGVLEEEFDEFTEAVRLKTLGDQTKRLTEARKEAVQVAAVSIKILLTIDAKLAKMGAKNGLVEQIEGQEPQSPTASANSASNRVPPVSAEPPAKPQEEMRPKDQRRSAGRASPEGEVRSLPAAFANPRTFTKGYCGGKPPHKPHSYETSKGEDRWCEGQPTKKRTERWKPPANLKTCVPCAWGSHDGCSGRRRGGICECPHEPTDKEFEALDALERMGKGTDVAERMEEELVARTVFAPYPAKRDPLELPPEEQPTHHIRTIRDEVLAMPRANLPSYRPEFKPHDMATCMSHPECRRLRGEKVPG